jgi:hypothetical protein
MRALIFQLIFLLSLSTPLFAQPFEITAIGELDLESDQIISPNVVNKYFGMNVSGAGESLIRVSIGDQSVDEDFEFKLSSTQVSSFLFSRTLANEVALAFRRGVSGTVNIALLGLDGTPYDSESFVLDVTFHKSNCRKFKSKRLPRCVRVDLATATAKQRLKLARVFAESIRGPIVLEP